MRSSRVSRHPPPDRGLPRAATVLVRSLTPSAEREEVLAGLAEEYGERFERHGGTAARYWLWRQVLGSIVPLLRRAWWRGWSGFEPRANRMHPGGPVLESWIMDLRYSARRLASHPGYAVLAVLTLALGAGGTAAIVSVARSLLLEPLPIAREEQVGVLWFPYSWRESEFLHVRPNFPGFQRMAAYRPEDTTLDVPGEPLRLVPGIAGSAELFDVLGTAPLLGRTFRAGDDLQGAEPVAVLSHGLWQEIGGDPSVVGQRIQLGGENRTIVGVMPPGFWFPSPATRVWLSTPFNPENHSGRYALIGRVEEGGRVTAMQGPLEALAAALGQRFTYTPQWDKTKNPAITPVREYLIGDARPAVVATLVAMSLILLIACVNVAALMLGQVSGRATELAVRRALGAGSRRLAEQLAIEALLVALLAGATGAVLAAASFGLLVQSLPLGALAENARLDWILWLAATIVALLAGGGIAAVPAFALWRGDLQRRMVAGGTGGISGRGGRLESGLLVAQIALAVLLAAGAGLLVRTVANLRALEPGIDPRGVAIVDATMPVALTSEARRQILREAVATLQAIPGVRAAAATQKLPLRGSGHNWGITVEGRPDLGTTTTAFRIVTHDYFEALGIELRSGRGFLPTDRPGTEPVVVINEALAAKYFQGEDPIGRRIDVGLNETGERIIGVVENVAEASLTDPPVPARYMLYDHVPPAFPGTTFVLRATRPDALPGLLQVTRATLHREAPQVAIERVATLQSIVDLAVGPAGQLVTLLSLLSGLALVLGAVGVYGVIAHSVGRRTREYAIRLALGLRPRQIVVRVVGRGLGLVAMGSLIGVLVAWAVTGLLSSLLYGVEPTDPVALGGAVLALLGVGALAAFVPAWRASLTDPASVLRQQ